MEDVTPKQPEGAAQALKAQNDNEETSATQPPPASAQPRQPRRGLTMSSADFPNYWRYSIGADFQSASGEPAQYISGHPKYRDADELAKLTFSTPVGAMAPNADGTLLALAVANDVHIYRAHDQSLLKVLRGHLSSIDRVLWHPGKPDGLVTSASRELRRPRASDDDDDDDDEQARRSQILFWNISEDGDDVGDADLAAVSRRAVAGIEKDIAAFCLTSQASGPAAAGQHAATKSNSRWAPSPSDLATLEKKIARLLHRYALKASLRNRPTIHGRLISLSPDGASVLFHPGERAQSNGSAPWDLHVLDYASKQVGIVMKGHTDYIAWADFNASSTLVATASWDGTFRIFDAKTGFTVYVFSTPELCQNWRGGFSPDGTMFAGSMGSGHFAVWNLESGAQIASFQFGEKGQWCRTLDWSPDSRYLAVGGRGLCRIKVVEPRAAAEEGQQSKQVVQDRCLSLDKCVVDSEDRRDILDNFLETRALKLIDGGKKLGYKLVSDRGLELYDFIANKKWRFAPEEGEERGQFDMRENDGWGPWVFLEKERRIVSVDGKTVRFWDVADA